MSSDHRSATTDARVEFPPSDPFVYIVFEREENYPRGVPYDCVIQTARRRMEMTRSGVESEIETRVEAGKLLKRRGDRLATR